MIYRIGIRQIPTVVRVGHIKYRHGWTERYCHTDNVLIYVVSGEFLYNFDSGKQVKLQAGSAHITPAHTSYTIRAEGDCDFYFIHFSSDAEIETVSDETAAAELQKMKQNQTEDRNAELYSSLLASSVLVSDLIFLGERAESVRYRISRCEEYRRGTAPLDRLRLQNSFFNLLLTIASVSGEKLMQSKHNPATVTKIGQFIEDNCTKPLSLSVLSDEFGFSKQYIMRLFRDNFGTTVSDYINGVKLRKSLDLLRFTGLSVSEVAYSLGYSSAYYFCRLFKARFSITPTEYQRSQKM